MPTSILSLCNFFIKLTKSKIATLFIYLFFYYCILLISKLLKNNGFPNSSIRQLLIYRIVFDYSNTEGLGALESAITVNETLGIQLIIEMYSTRCHRRLVQGSDSKLKLYNLSNLLQYQTAEHYSLFHESQAFDYTFVKRQSQRLYDVHKHWVKSVHNQIPFIIVKNKGSADGEPTLGMLVKNDHKVNKLFCVPWNVPTYLCLSLAVWRRVPNTERTARAAPSMSS